MSVSVRLPSLGSVMCIALYSCDGSMNIGVNGQHNNFS
jgi:hypothetical protein